MTTFVDGQTVVNAAWLNKIDQSGSTYIPPGAGAVATTVAGRLNQTAVFDSAWGADPTGILDSSSGLQLLLNSGPTLIIIPPPNAGKKYIIHDVVIPNGVTVYAYGAYFIDAPGANWIFKLSGYSSRLLGAYIFSALNCAQATILAENCVLSELVGIRIYNAINGFKFQSTGSVTSYSGGLSYTDHVQCVDCYCNTFTGIGFWITKNVSEIRGLNVYLDAGLVSGGGGLIPRASSTGFLFDGTASTVAYGGHVMTQCQASNSQDGWYFNNANLIFLNSCLADGNSARGFAFDGNTNLVQLAGLQAGVAWNGMWFGGTTQAIWSTGLTTLNNGVIPPGGGTTYYTSYASGYNGYTATGSAYDIVTTGTATTALDEGTWLASQGTAHSYNVGAGSKLNFTGGNRLNFSSLTTIASGGTTAYLGPVGQSSVNGATVWVAPHNCIIQSFYVQFNVAPGAGSYTFTLYINSSAAGLTGTITGSGVFVLEVLNGTQIGISKGNSIQLQIVQNGSNGAAYFNGYLNLLPQP